MDVIAVAKYVRMSPSKGRDVARKVQGLPVAEALRMTRFSPRKAAFHINKTLKSAVANAQSNHSLEADDLRVKQAVVDEGPAMRRFWPRARGGVSPVQKRMCHIRIVLTDGVEESPEDEDAASGGN